MNARRFVVCNILMVSLCVRADENFTALDMGGERYNHVTVMMVTVTDIFFTYQGGLRNLKLKDLSPALQTYFHYDAAQAEIAEQAQAQANARYYESLANAPRYVNPPAADDFAQAWLPKWPGRLPSKIFLIGFLIFAPLFFLTNLASYLRGRRSGRARQRLDQRLQSLALMDLREAAPQQITFGPRSF